MGRVVAPQWVSPALLRRWQLPPMDAQADKVARGTVLIVAGSTEVPGAAILAGVAALRAGAGRLVVAVPRSIAIAVAPHLPEARVVGLPASPDGRLAANASRRLAQLARTADTLLVGPGMVQSDKLPAVVKSLAERFATMPIALDAAALEAAPPGLRRGESPRVVLTPHAGEMAKMLRVERSSIEANQVEFAQRAARTYSAVVVLKAATTIIALPDGAVWMHKGDIAGLATSGSGDVLAGLIAGLLARGAAAEQAAVWGVALHGLAGRSLARRSGPVGFLAREIAGEIPTLLRNLARRPKRIGTRA